MPERHMRLQQHLVATKLLKTFFHLKNAYNELFLALALLAIHVIIPFVPAKKSVLNAVF